MEPSAVLAVLGVVLLGAYALEVVARRTRVPDALWLVAAGAVLGRALGWQHRGGLESADRMFVRAAILVILFHGGVVLDLSALRRGLGRAALLAATSLLASIAVAMPLVHFGFVQPWPAAALVGAMLGGTAALLVVPMVQSLGVQEPVATLLAVEARLSQALCTVVAISLLSVVAAGGGVGRTAELASAKLAASLALGIATALVWAAVRAELERRVRKGHLGVLALLFGVAGGADALGLSGSLAAFAFGAMLANLHSLPFGRRLAGGQDAALTSGERYFVVELSFLLRTYFFLYVGVIVDLHDLRAVGMAALLILLVHAVRPLLVRLALPGHAVRHDAVVSAAFAPRGLVAIVLARLVAHLDIPAAGLLSDTAVCAVVLSMIAATVLVHVLRRPDVRLFGRWFDGYPERPPAPARTAAQ